MTQQEKEAILNKIKLWCKLHPPVKSKRSWLAHISPECGCCDKCIDGKAWLNTAGYSCRYHKILYEENYDTGELILTPRHKDITMLEAMTTERERDTMPNKVCIHWVPDERMRNNR